MTTDVTGVELVQGNSGKDCPGNGEHSDENGNAIEFLCDECSFLMCYTSEEACENCVENNCPRFSHE